jgi:hypothetical protein
MILGNAKKTEPSCPQNSFYFTPNQLFSAQSLPILFFAVIFPAKQHVRGKNPE